MNKMQTYLLLIMMSSAKQGESRCCELLSELDRKHIFATDHERRWSLHEKPAGDLTYCPYQANLPCLRQVVC